MLTFIRRNSIALVALSVALGGTSYAAVALPRNSVAAKQIRPAAVRSSDVKDGSLTTRDFKASALVGAAGATGAAGSQGLTGPTGPTGPAGQAGAAGVAGADGKDGKDGVDGKDGAQGPQGEQGPQGAAGPSGTVAVRGVEGVWSGTQLVGNNGNTITTPNDCRTGLYFAHAGEYAVVSAQGTATPSNPATDVLYVNVMLSEGFGSNFKVMTEVDQAESMSDGTAQTSTSKVIPLEANTYYRFGAGFASNGSVGVSTGYCSLTATIVKTA